MLVHNVLADPKTQTSANILLGCEEGFEKTLASFRRNPWAGIGDGDPHSSQLLETMMLVLRDSNANLPTGLYCVDTVAQQIRNELPDLTCNSKNLWVVENFRTNFNSLVAAARSKYRDERIEQLADLYNARLGCVAIKTKCLFGDMRDAVQLSFRIRKKLAYVVAQCPIFCEINKVGDSFQWVTVLGAGSAFPEWIDSCPPFSEYSFLVNR